jgi:hypothetical protein
MQIATILSCGPQTWSHHISNWNVVFEYQTDAGSTQQYSAIVGNGQDAVASLWASPDSTVSVTAPGAASPILIACPDIVRWAAFGIPEKGFPVA